MNTIKDFFVKHTNYKLEDIDYVKPIHSGYSNHNYLLYLKSGKKFQIKISKQVIENRENCAIAIELSGDKSFLYLNAQGDAIRKWQKGNTIKDWNDQLLFLIARKLKQLHSIKPIGLVKHNYKQRLFMDLNTKYLDAYLRLVEKYENDKLVFSHNDLNAENIIEDDNVPHFLDFEYARANSLYWDLANLINEADLNEWQQKVLTSNYGKIDKDKLHDYIFIHLFFSYTWVLDYPDKHLINKYKIKLKDKLINFDLTTLSA